MTALWGVKKHADKIIDYVLNPEKTTEEKDPFHPPKESESGFKAEKGCFVTCLNCRKEEAAGQFTETKEYWSRVRGEDLTGGRSCLHGYQSFKPGEVTARMAHEIGVRLAKQLFAERFEVVVATHINTGHYHSHFVINSVSWRDGRRFHGLMEYLRYMREISNTLCREYGLSVIENPLGRRIGRGEYMAQKKGEPTNRSLIRDDIDRAARACLTGGEFLKALREMGYELKLVNDDGTPIRNPLLRPPGGKMFFAFHNLGPGYELDEVLRRVAANYHREVPFPEEEKKRLKLYREKTAPKEKARGLWGLYLKYCYELNIIHKFPGSVKRVSFFMREDLRRLDRLNEQTQFLTERKIETIEDLNAFRKEAGRELAELENKRRLARNEYRRMAEKGDDAALEEIQRRRKELTKETRKLRRRLILADEIEERSKGVEIALEELSEEQKSLEREVKAYEQRYGGSGRADRKDEPGRG